MANDMQQRRDIFYCTAHGVLLALIWGLALGSVVYLLCVWPSVPHWVGYHFAGDGSFNLFGSKNIAFLHPVIAEFLVDALMLGLSAVAFRLRPVKGFPLALHRRAVWLTALLCDVIALVWALLFTHWIACVARQTPLNTRFAVALIWSFVAAFMLYFVWLLSAAIIAHRQKAKIE